MRGIMAGMATGSSSAPAQRHLSMPSLVIRDRLFQVASVIMG